MPRGRDSCSIPALHDVDLGPCPTQCVELCAPNALDGYDLAPLCGFEWRDARTHRLAVQVHGARTAQRFAAPNFVPTSFSSPRSTHDKGVSGSAFTVCVLPLIESVVTAIPQATLSGRLRRRRPVSP